MSVLEESAQPLATPAAQAKRRKRRRPKWRDTWWRHLVGIIAVAFALFPVVYIVSGAFNADDTLAAAKLIPRKVTFDNFTELFTNTKENARATPTTASHYGRWYVNSLVVATLTSILTVMLGAIAAYAFSRFRFRGRRMGLVSLLLIQMFPSLLLVVAIYLIVLRVGDVFPSIGLNTLAGLIIVYLGGVLGINTWLMKGFLDSIPNELDESARVDGATPAQTFWGVILPLAAPVLAVIALLSFIGTINEFIIASVLLQTTDKWTLPVGMYGYVNDQYAQHWGPFAAGVILSAIPVVVVFMSLQRFIVHGLTQGSVKG
jgi:arabinogalactan oligomer / maltooligosaccharide transport system permease protein